MAAGERRSYSGNAVTTTPTANFNSAATTFSITDPTGYPDGTTGPFFVQVDSEVIKITGRAGATLSVQTVPVSGRGWDGTTAASHTTSSTVSHVYTKTDADEANEHYSNIALDHHTQYLTTLRHDLSARHPITVLPVGSPGASAPGDTASAGVATSLAKSDHRHSREADTTTRVGVTLAAASFSVPNGGTTTISWTTETVDTSAFIAVPSSTITVPTGLGGIYAITVSGTWAGSFTETRNLFITAAGTLYPIPMSTVISGLGGATIQNWTGVIVLPLIPTNTVSVSIAHENAGAQSTTANLFMYRVAA